MILLANSPSASPSTSIISICLLRTYQLNSDKTPIYFQKSLEGRQAIIWPKMSQKLHENENVGVPAPSPTPLGSANAKANFLGQKNVVDALDNHASY